MKTYTLECDNCGAAVKIKARQQIYKCEYCDSTIQIPKKIYDEMNQVDHFQAESEKKRQNVLRDAAGEKAFKSDKRAWNMALIIWVAAICVSFALESSSAYEELIRSYWPSLFIIGGACMIATKPRKLLYLGIHDENKQKKLFTWIPRWRLLLYVWAIVMSLCWGIPSDYEIHDTMFNLGMALLIFGLVFFIRYRPAKYISLQD